MRTRSLLAAACLAALSGAAFAEDAHHPADAAKPAAKPAQGMEMMNMGAMGETMQRMHEQMKKIQNASDPDERQRLVEEHMKAMHEAMPMMARMQGCMGMTQPQK